MERNVQIVSATFNNVLKETITLGYDEIDTSESDLFCKSKDNKVKLQVRISDVVQLLSVTLFHENKEKPFTLNIIDHPQFRKPLYIETSAYFDAIGKNEFILEFTTSEKSKDGKTVEGGAKPFILAINAYADQQDIGCATFRFHTNIRQVPNNKRPKSQKDEEVVSSDYYASSPMMSNNNNYGNYPVAYQPALETPPSTSDPYEVVIPTPSPSFVSSFSVNPSLPSSEVAEKLLPVLGEDATTTIVEYILDPLGTQRISAEAMSYFLTNFGLESKDEWLLWLNELGKLKPYKFFHGIVINDESFDEKSLSVNKCFYIRLSNTKLHTIIWTVFEDGEPSRTPLLWNKALASHGWRRENQFTMEQTLDLLLNQIPIDKRDKFLAKKPKYNKNL